jgi:putative ABC transport system permease protein
MGQLVRDLRFGARSLSRSPGFAAVALATIALGIGANTAIFSVVDAVLLSPLPFPGADRLVAVFQTQPSRGVSGNGASYPNFDDWRNRSRSFEELAAIRMHDYTLTGHGDPLLVTAGTVTSNLFRMLEDSPILGRTLAAVDDDPGAPSVAVLGERLWRARFSADPAIVGKAILLDQKPVVVVGVMPARFKTPPETPPVELWLTLTHDPVFGDLRERRGGHYLRVVGRLKSGTTAAEAGAELASVQAALAREHPKENEGWGVQIVPLAESLVSGVRTALLVLLGAVGLVFAIACANVANLLLARASARAREVAIRTALGAGRGRLLGQFLAEGVLLAVTGGALGVGLAFAGLKGLKAWIPADLPRVSEIRLDTTVLLFALGASLVAAVAFGLAPAFQAAGANLSSALKEGSSGAGEGKGRRRLRRALVVAETALSFVLLIGAGLLARSFLRLQEAPIGFQPSGVLTAGLSLPRTQYAKPEQWIGFYGRLVERLQSEPGVESAAAVLPLPMTGSGLNFAFTVEGRAAPAAGADLTANYTALTPDYFRVLRVPLLRGRLFTASDAASAPKVCVVSDALVRRHFPGEDPIGRRIVFGFTGSVARTIIGVVGDVKRDGPGAASQPEMYVPFEQDPWWAAYLAIRTKGMGDSGALSAAIRREVAALDPSLPVADIQPMTAIVHDSVSQPRFRTTLLGLFGVTALLLAVIGIYGLIAYDVGRRAREIAIRLALGASRRDVLGLVFRQGLALTGIGLAVGAAGAAVLTRFLSSLLFETRPIDPATYAAVAALLLAAGLLACWVPARRALSVDPNRVLRSE